MEASKSNVVVVGSANQDLTSYTANLPVLGETVMGTKFETACGGKGANQAVAAACLDIAPVSMICRVGEDTYGETLLSNFRKANVNYDGDKTSIAGTSTGIAHIVVDTESGDNMIIVVPGANYELTPGDVKEEVQSVLNSGTGDSPPVVLLQLEIKSETVLEALRVGKDSGATTILNTAPAPVGWTLEEFYPYVDILIPNETELRSIAGGGDDEEAMARSLLDKGVGRAVVVTLGKRGAMVVAKEADGETKVTLVDAPSDLPCRDEPVVDTIGAGDAFCGSLSVYLSSGVDLLEAAEKACGVASMSVRKQGAQSSYPTSKELPDCLKIDSVMQTV